MKQHSLRSRSAGFTLLELMITVAVVAILSTIAYASYQDQVIRSRRAAAAACLQERAQFMERFYTTNMTYVGANPTACDASLAGHYAVPMVVAATHKTYTLQIAPTGAQETKDTKCGTLTVDQRGVRGESGSAASADECW